MRWFKHLTHAHEDEKIAVLIDEAGLEGYGFWWLMIEILASQMDAKSDKCEVVYPLKTWARLCGLLSTRWLRLAQLVANSQLWTLETFEGVAKVNCPNLLKFRDEYSGRSRQTPDKLPIVSRARTDTDTDTEVEVREDIPQPSASGNLPNPEVKIFIDWYHSEHLRVIGQKLHVDGKVDGARTKAMLGTLGLVELQRRALLHLQSSDPFAADKGIRHLGTCINRYAGKIEEEKYAGLERKI